MPPKSAGVGAIGTFEVVQPARASRETSATTTAGRCAAPRRPGAKGPGMATAGGYHRRALPSGTPARAPEAPPRPDGTMGR